MQFHSIVRLGLSASIALVLLGRSAHAQTSTATTDETAAPAAAPASAQGSGTVSVAGSAGTGKTQGASELAKPAGSDPLYEKYNHWYMAIGVGYRGTVVPSFLFKPFVQGVPTAYFSTFRISADFRKNGFSVVPSLSFTEYGTGDMLLLQRNKREEINGNWSVVNSNLKSINAEVDLLWSSKVHRMVDIEYGLGVGVGATFDKLLINWVYPDANGPYTSESGRRFAQCQSNVNPSGTTGCTARDHSNAETDKVGGYNEPSWFNGGSKPSFLPWLTPEVGVRIKPHKNFMTRIGIGWGLYGPWFGVSGFYFHDKPIAHAARPRGSDEEVVETSE